MGFNISGIVLSENFEEKINELQYQIGLNLEFEAEITFEAATENWKEKGFCDIYFSDSGTLIFLNMDYCIDPWSFAKGNTLAFSLSETSMAFSFNYCEKNTLRRRLLGIDDEIIEEGGEELDIEKETPDLSELIWKQLEITLGKNYWNIELSEKAYRYKLNSINKTKLQKVDGIIYKESDLIVSNVENEFFKENLKNFSLLKANALFDILIDQDNDIVSNSLNKINRDDINSHTLAYILNLSKFHYSLKIRNLAKKVLTNFAPPDLISKLERNWKNSFRTNQEYHSKELYEHPSISSSEYLVFSQAIRRNYFLVKPKKGMTKYISMRYGDEVENIFDCYQVHLENISENVTKLKHITVANFRRQPILDIDNTIQILAKLPNLRFLQIADSGLIELPSSIQKLSNLKTLIIEQNPISQFPMNIVFKKLEKLDIKSTSIVNINLEQFPNLKELWIDGEYKLNKMVFQNYSSNFIIKSGINWKIEFEEYKKSKPKQKNKWWKW
jgi:hypothetical protein